MNGIHETADISEIKDSCISDSDSYICPPDSLHISRRSPHDQCSFQIVSSKLSSSEIDMDDCSLLMFKNLTEQQFLIQNNILLISSPYPDSLRYLCKNATHNRESLIKYGLNLFFTKKGCHYETSYLQIRNQISLDKELSLLIEDETVSIIKEVSNLESLIDDENIPSTNLSSLLSSLKRYGSDVITADKTVEQISRQIDELDTLRVLSSFSPTTLDLARPFHTSNWMAAMFWILFLMAIILVWSIICHHSWYIKRIAPILPFLGK